jgi:hypothetical protein
MGERVTAAERAGVREDPPGGADDRAPMEVGCRGQPVGPPHRRGRLGPYRWRAVVGQSPVQAELDPQIDAECLHRLSHWSTSRPASSSRASASAPLVMTSPWLSTARSGGPAHHHPDPVGASIITPRRSVPR